MTQRSMIELLSSSTVVDEDAVSNSRAAAANGDGRTTAPAAKSRSPGIADQITIYDGESFDHGILGLAMNQKESTVNS